MAVVMPLPPLFYTAADDAYHRLADLLGLMTNPDLRFVGSLFAQTNGFVVRLGDQTTPPTSAGGVPIAINASYDVESEAAAWPIGVIWVRNTVAGSNTTIAGIGTLHKAL